jgi:predicted nuclease of predicted toxin-antitoxin system
VKLLADVHISPVTVTFLNALGLNTVRVAEVLSPSASDRSIVEYAFAEDRTVLTQDLDFSAIMALSGQHKPSIITLRLTSSRIEHVNALLEKALPIIEQDISNGSLVTIEDHGIRSRALPL